MHHCPQHFVFKTIFRARPGLSPFSFEGKLPHQQVEDSPHTFASNGSNISACVLDATSRNFNSPCSVHGYLPPNHGRELIVLRHYVSALHKHRRQHAHAPADTMMTPRTDDSIAGASLSPSHTRPLLLTRSLSLIPPKAQMLMVVARPLPVTLCAHGPMPTGHSQPGRMGTEDGPLQGGAVLPRAHQGHRHQPARSAQATSDHKKPVLRHR